METNSLIIWLPMQPAPEFLPHYGCDLEEASTRKLRLCWSLATHWRGPNQSDRMITGPVAVGVSLCLKDFLGRYST